MTQTIKKMNIETLKERQQWTLSQKIDHSLGVIDQFNSHFNGQVFVSFSGGKDSVAMLSLVEMIIPKVKCMFVMTGCESPSVCRFVREMKSDGHNIDIVKPDKTLRQVFAEYGFPLVSKEVSHHVCQVRRNPDCATAKMTTANKTRHGIPARWLYLIDEPYNVSDRCCFWLKKQPAYNYTKRTGLRPFIGLTATESHMRTMAYLKRGGCNAFFEDSKHHAASWPLAIWNEDDVWQFINDRHLPLPDIYQHGANRTGCMGCGFGAHIHGESLEVMQRLWPRWYAMVMDFENNGTRYGDALTKMIERGKHFKKSNGNNQDIQTAET